MTTDPVSVTASYPLLDALRNRRARRFGLGMKMPAGAMAFESAHPGLRLSEDEEALLAFAACGLTGPALGDLIYTPKQGGTIMAGIAGRTVFSGDCIQMVALVVTNDDGTWLMKRPRDFEPRELGEVVALAREGRFTEVYHRSRIRIADTRSAPPLEPLSNLDVNRWSLYDPASSYFLPIDDLTLLYINGLLEIFGETTGAFIVDERRSFRPAGLRRFARSRGGHLRDDPRHERIVTIQQLETLVLEFSTVEQGMMLQNLGLMVQAMGLGGFPHWAAHGWTWAQALGFRNEPMPASRYLGMGAILRVASRLLGRDFEVPNPVGLERDGTPLLEAYCPPWYPSMEAAVRAVVELKFGSGGLFNGGLHRALFRDAQAVEQDALPPTQAAIDATTAYCEYVYGCYGRFPAYPPPFRTVLGFQVSHVDVDFYDRFYRPGALSETQRRHLELWHPQPSRDA